jgi:hypothetical protein
VHNFVFCPQYIPHDDGEVVILEDNNADMYMAVGERRGTYFPPAMCEDSSADGKLIWVHMKVVLRPKTPLPVVVTDYRTRLKCRTLGEAYLAKVGIWWKERDTMLTNDDGCTYSRLTT